MDSIVVSNEMEFKNFERKELIRIKVFFLRLNEVLEHKKPFHILFIKIIYDFHRFWVGNLLIQKQQTNIKDRLFQILLLLLYICETIHISRFCRDLSQVKLTPDGACSPERGWDKLDCAWTSDAAKVPSNEASGEETGEVRD